VAPGATHLRIVRAYPTEVFAQWFDPRLGLRHAMIR
jgi:hypothetical protein